MEPLIATEISHSLLPTSPKSIITTANSITTTKQYHHHSQLHRHNQHHCYHQQHHCQRSRHDHHQKTNMNRMNMILILLLPMSIVHADNNVDVDAQQAGPEMDTRICRDRSAAGTHRGSLFSAKRQPPNPTGLLLKFCRWCTIASILIVTSHLLRMVVVALPLTHQKGPRSGIFRAQPSLSGGDSPPTSSQPSSPIEAAPPPRDLSSYTRLSWGTQPHLRGWMVSRSPPHPSIVIPTDSSQPRRSHARTWDPLIITGTVTC